MSLSRVNAQVCNDWQLDEIARLTNGRKVGRFIRIAPGNRRRRRPRIFLELQRYAQDDRQNLLQLSMAATLRASRTTLDRYLHDAARQVRLERVSSACIFRSRELVKRNGVRRGIVGAWVSLPLASLIPVVVADTCESASLGRQSTKAATQNKGVIS